MTYSVTSGSNCSCNMSASQDALLEAGPGELRPKECRASEPHLPFTNPGNFTRSEETVLNWVRLGYRAREFMVQS